ncbi:MAG: DUF3726 domain-containing protein, partial [Acidimicrobiales bacterium]|nr:DUF3726 domain-containing protein [Acidimicrobiales bacterium]
MAAGSVIELSLNEIETTVTKAAIGCGIDIGRAAAIGTAARWLCARGIDGISEAAALLAGCGQAPGSDPVGIGAIDVAVATDRPVVVPHTDSPQLL